MVKWLISSFIKGKNSLFENMAVAFILTLENSVVQF